MNDKKGLMRVGAIFYEHWVCSVDQKIKNMHNGRETKAYEKHTYVYLGIKVSPLSPQQNNFSKKCLLRQGQRNTNHCYCLSYHIKI